MRCVSARPLVVSAVLLAGMAAFLHPDARAACCYFSAVGSDVNQPAQKAFITFDPAEDIESFTVQPKFEGNAADFGMVIPTPSRPKLNEMPRAFFKELATFTILKPMPLDKYKQFRFRMMVPSMAAGGADMMKAKRSTVRVLEAGVVGSLEYKIVTAERADDLYSWLKQNKYSYSGDEPTLGNYIQRKWVFTVMRVDPKQMKRGADGKYQGEITPTRFTFSTPSLIYPLRITKISVTGETEALFYVQAPFKVDLPGPFSYQYTWTPMLRQALSFAVPEKVTPAEKAWMQTADAEMPKLQQAQQAQFQEYPQWQPAKLEWAKKLTAKDLAILNGTAKFDREADADAIRDLKLLRGHLKQGQWITKFRKVFRRGEMDADLEFVRARLGGKPDEIDYEYILPTSPP
jgi:hypothetical protein